MRLDIRSLYRAVLFYEQCLDPLLTSSLGKSLRIFNDYVNFISECSIVISCVGTPECKDGNINLDYVFQAAEQTAMYLKQDGIFVQKSTVPVGTGEKIEALFCLWW